MRSRRRARGSLGSVVRGRGGAARVRKSRPGPQGLRARVGNSECQCLVNTGVKVTAGTWRGEEEESDRVKLQNCVQGKGEWIAAVSVAAGAAVVGYLAYRKLFCKGKCSKAMVNLHIQKDNPKVVHAFDMEDLGDKAVYCRCWRSKKFPLCDGSHTKHNEETGDNVGPLIIKRKEA
ncbi:CDGSH iron-sulfur domain-containing protein 1 isoform X2 [Onychostruthus taczanowskii]|uniref:CDGSH iron-sulfur domain-containing protein 1 isoform X2 n=1 Tax=Onychostruthus taczanowskii TaxID=356909 RepID=UPI001B8075D9|nr:CDGSH iron-sulfur domain-containing protein 1 isoform X2 [Onychostruthus taczanowskii]